MWVLGLGIDGEGEGERKVREVVGERMRRVKEWEGDDDWSWEREVEGYFGNLSLVMRGSFKGLELGVEVDYY